MNTGKRSGNISEISRSRRGLSAPFAAALLCALLLTVAAWEARAEDYRESYEKGLKYIEAWDVGRAEIVARALMEQAPADPRYRYLMARVLFYKGEYTGANETLSDAIRQLGGDVHATHLAEMIRRTMEASKSLTAFREEDLVISLDAEKDSILIPYIREAMGRALRAVEKRLGYRPPRLLRVEVYPDAESFHLASSLTRRDIEVSGAVGICKFNKIMLISPRALARGYPWLDTLSHEYMHYVIVKLSANRAPVWLHEGMAKYYEAAWRSDSGFSLDPVPRTLLARALKNDSLITFDEMYPSLVMLETTEQVQLAYAEAVTAIAFIVSAAGDAGLRKILLRMAEEPPRDPMYIIESSLGMKRGEFTSGWMGHLRSLRLKPVEGLEVLQHKVKGAFYSASALDLKEIKSEVSRNHLRLGDMLKQRGRISAAALEYRRALSHSPHSPVILNRLGSALARMGAFEKGVEKLKLAEELYPGFGPTYKKLAEIFQQQNRLSLAQEYFVKAIHINPFDPSPHVGLRAVLLAMGRTGEAREEEAILKKLAVRTADRSGDGAPHTGDADE